MNPVSTPNSSLKQLIASNLVYLMLIYDRSRRDVCSDLDIRYTTFTDWVKGNSYPRMDALEQLSSYFRVNVRDFFIEIPQNTHLCERLTAYAERLGVCLPGVEWDTDNENLFSVEDYYNTPEGYPLELIRGKFFIMESPGPRHQRIVMELSAEIRNYIRRNKGKCRIYPGPFDVELPTEKGTVVVPDITVICDNGKIDHHGCKGAPDWIIEVLSDTTKGKDPTIKKAVYQECGVREYWIVDQFTDRVLRFTLTTDDTPDNYSDRTFYGDPEVYRFNEEIPCGIYPDLKLCLSELDID